MEKTYAKGYIDRNTCLDGTNSHEWTTKDYSGEGTITICTKCGYYCQKMVNKNKCDWCKENIEPQDRVLYLGRYVHHYCAHELEAHYE